MAKHKVQDASKLVRQPGLRELFTNSESISIVAQIINETILQDGAEILYLKYIEPKVRPYTAMHSIESIKMSLLVSQTSTFKFNENKRFHRSNMTRESSERRGAV